MKAFTLLLTNFCEVMENPDLHLMIDHLPQVVRLAIGQAFGR